MPALLALLVSMLFTLFAVRHPDAATIAAAPVALLAAALLLWARRWHR